MISCFQIENTGFHTVSPKGRWRRAHSFQLPGSFLYFELSSSKNIFMVEGVHRLESVFKVAKTKHNIKLFFFFCTTLCIAPGSK